MEDLNALEEFLAGIYPLRKVEMTALLVIWQPFSCKRKTVLTGTPAAGQCGMAFTNSRAANGIRGQKPA
jgi:hypothetical protein